MSIDHIDIMNKVTKDLCDAYTEIEALRKERDKLLKTKRLWDEYQFENWSARIEVQKQYIEQIQAERDEYREALERLANQNGNEFAMQSEAQDVLAKYPKEK